MLKMFSPFCDLLLEEPKHFISLVVEPEGFEVKCIDDFVGFEGACHIYKIKCCSEKLKFVHKSITLNYLIFARVMFCLIIFSHGIYHY